MGKRVKLEKHLSQKVSDNVEIFHKIEDIFSQEALLHNLSNQLNEKMTLSKLIQFYNEKIQS